MNESIHHASDTVYRDVVCFATHQRAGPQHTYTHIQGRAGGPHEARYGSLRSEPDTRFSRDCVIPQSRFPLHVIRPWLLIPFISSLGERHPSLPPRSAPRCRAAAVARASRDLPSERHQIYLPIETTVSPNTVDVYRDVVASLRTREQVPLCVA